MADECTDGATHEQMAICVRFVNEFNYGLSEIREEFLGFVDLERTDAAFVSEAILTLFS